MKSSTACETSRAVQPAGLSARKHSCVTCGVPFSLIGTDTPAGTGVTPRGILRTLGLISSLGGVEPEISICFATGNVARAHHLDTGLIRPGMPADLVIMGKIQGCQARDDLDVFRIGDLPGVTMVIIDGKIRIRDRSYQTPPPLVRAVVEKE